MAPLSRTEASTIIAAADDPAVTAQMYRDEAALYPMVGKVTGSGLSGSGVLISDRWVLTAGHVAYGKTTGTFNVGATNLDLFHAWIFAQTGITAIPEADPLWICCLACLLGLRRRR